MGLVRYSIVDKGQLRIGSDGVSQLDMYLVAEMASLNDSKLALQIGLAGYQRYQPHATETGMYVDQFQATQKTHTKFWECMVTYTDKINGSPLDVPAVIGEIQTYTIPGATLVDYAGNAILNTAGEPPEPFDFPERVMQIPIIKNIPADVPQWLWDFEDCVNADAVQLPNGDTVVTCAPKTLLVSSVKASAINEQSGTNYRVMTMEILRRKSTWEQIFPSRGFNQRVTEKVIRSVPTSGSVTFSNVTQLSPILIKGEVPTEAQFLDRNGKWIPHPSPSDVVLLKALLQRPIPFSTFPLN